MKRNTTFNLDDELVQRSKSYAAAHGTTLTALVRDHLAKVTGFISSDEEDPLVAFSKGTISKSEAIRRSGLRDYAELLVALGDRGLDLPRLPPHVINEMKETVLRVHRSSKVSK
jgi:plasmid stability protein